MLRWLICIFLIVSAPAAASAEDDANGLWAWRIENRTALLLNLASDGETGGLSRLKHFSMDANAGYWRLIPQTQEIVSDPIVERRRDGADWLLSIRDADDGRLTVYRFRATSIDEAELSLEAAPGVPVFNLHRTTDISLAEDWQLGRAYGEPPVRADNPELAQLFNADQRARAGATGPLGAGVEQADAERRLQARALLDGGGVQSASDYFHAAFIFQHGDRPDDYLLAHALAMNALALGRPDGVWIAAASLDRYLHSIGKAQIYGTQFQTPLGGKATTQGVFDRELLPDTVRRDSGVPVLSDQNRQRVLFDETP